MASITTEPPVRPFDRPRDRRPPARDAWQFEPAHRGRPRSQPLDRAWRVRERAAEARARTRRSVSPGRPAGAPSRCWAPWRFGSYAAVDDAGDTSVRSW